MAIDKEALFKSRLTEEEVDVPGVGAVRIRALSRTEALSLRGVEMPVEELERRLLAMALVDPVLTQEEVRQWQEASSAGELEPITRAIAELSGMETTAPKTAMRQFRG